MSDLSAVRTEIKSWERNFKTQNGRDPSIQDIKDNPAIEQKYKLYKKLSKASLATFSRSSKSTDPPSTPPRQQSHVSRPVLLPPQAQVAESCSPLSTFNPFSPRKDKSSNKGSSVQSRPNAFITPVKQKSRIQKSDPSPDPFPPIQPLSHSLASAPVPPLPVPSSALSRARKRLRGDPVSPSPSKEKRRRVGSLSSIPFPDLNDLTSSDEAADVPAVQSSFIADSPVKAPAPGKSYTALFEDSLPIVKSIGLPGHIAKTSATLSAVDTTDAEWDPDSMFKSTGKRFSGSRKNSSNRSTTKQGRLISKKSDIFADSRSDSSQSPAHSQLVRSSKAGPSRISSPGSRPTTKRVMVDAEIDGSANTSSYSASSQPLLRPSPPPTSSSSLQPSGGTRIRDKGKQKASERQKSEVLNEEDGDDDSEIDTLEGHVKLVDRTRSRTHRPGYENVELDPETDLIHVFGVRSTHRVDLPHGVVTSAESVGYDIDTGKFDVDLPDKLKEVLAISPSKGRDSKEENLVRGLLYGRREIHYDPVKGGEIWDVGEDVRGEDVEADVIGRQTSRDEDDEDDWEGEPVPWEVGEL